MFCLYLLPSVARKYLSDRNQRQAGEQANILAEGSMFPATPEDGENVEERGGEMQISSDRLSTHETMRLSAEFCLIWFFVCLPIYPLQIYVSYIHRQTTSTPTV